MNSYTAAVASAKNVNYQNRTDTAEENIKQLYHPAGDVLWVFVEPGNVVP